MKITKLIFLLPLLFLFNTGNAQNNYRFKQGSEIGLSIGYLPLNNISTNFMFPMKYDDVNYFQNSLDGLFSDSQVWQKNIYTTGAINFTYTYRLKRWLELSATATYNGFYSNYYNDIDNSFAFTNRSHSISVLPELRFVWLNSEYVRLYSSMALGLSYYSENSKEMRYRDSGITGAGKFTPIGLKVGAKKLYGFGEMSVGSTGFFLIGIGYKLD